MLVAAAFPISLTQASHVPNDNVVVSLQPSSVTATTVGQTFSLKFNVANVNDLDGWEFTVVFDPTVVNILPSTTYVYEGFTSPATDPLTVKRAITLDNDFGTVAAGATAFPLPDTGITGSGNLFRLDFTVVAVPTAPSPIEFFDLLLRSVTPGAVVEIITPVQITGATVLPPPVFDFSVNIVETGATINAGKPASATVNVARTSGSGTSGTVTLTASVSPPPSAGSITASLARTSIALNDATPSDTTTLSITTTEDLTANIYTVTVAGSTSPPSPTPADESDTFTLTVQTLAFTLSANPTSGSVEAGQSLTNAAVIAATVTSGSPVPISLTATVSPVPSMGTITPSFSPNPFTPPATSTMSISTTADVPAGDYTITIMGSAQDPITAQTTFMLTVTVRPPGVDIIDISSDLNNGIGDDSPITVTEPVTYMAIFSAAGQPVVPCSFTWSFGDGGTAVTDTPSATHTYMAAGTLTVSVTANCSNGSDSHSEAFTVFKEPGPVRARYSSHLQVEGSPPGTLIIIVKNSVPSAVTVNLLVTITNSNGVVVAMVPVTVNCDPALRVCTGGGERALVPFTGPPGTYTATITGTYTFPSSDSGSTPTKTKEFTIR